jgi:hypothetical protein
VSEPRAKTPTKGSRTRRMAGSLPSFRGFGNGVLSRAFQAADAAGGRQRWAQERC